jgi:biopolymer transport protein ExbB
MVAAGWIGWLIMGLSMLALTLIFKEVMEIRKVKLAPPEIVDEIEALLEAEEYQEAMEVCESEPCYFTNVVAAGLPKLNASFEAMEKSLEEMMEEENTKLYGRLSWLSLIAAVAPMMGLLGTVGGMIGAFNQIAASKGQATPDQLANNISMALITTMLGLMVAIPVTAAFVFLRNRVVAYSLEISAVIEDMFERFRPRKS